MLTVHLTHHSAGAIVFSLVPAALLKTLPCTAVTRHTHVFSNQHFLSTVNGARKKSVGVLYIKFVSQ